MAENTTRIVTVSETVSNRPARKSLGYTPRPLMALPPPIPEDEEDDDRKTSFTKKPPSRSNSVVGVKAKIFEMRGFESDEKVSNGVTAVTTGGYSFQRGYTDSTRSSTHESVKSLQVQREQYCCFSRWSTCERRLATSVGILAGIIVVLVITVGLLARGNNGVDERFVWKP